jgi:membrane-anchored protein YejM (alkaline phosphatase superfamily)
MGESQQQPLTRGQLLRWLGWFGISNAGLYGLVGLRYLLAFGMPDGLLASVYVGFAFIAQFAVLGWLPLMLLLGPLSLLLPRKQIVMPLGVLVAALILSILVLDTNIFAQYRYHLNGLTVALFETSTWIMTAVIFLTLLVFQSMLAGGVMKQVLAKPNRRGRLLALVLVLTWLSGQGIHIWADATAITPVTSFTRYLPAYYPMKAKRDLAKLGLVDPAEVEQQRLLRQADAPDSGSLNYPLNPLACSLDSAEKLNVVFVLIDALRPDKITIEHTPVIAGLAATGQNFSNHYSGGNSSRMGIFSLFYGLPSTYWQAFYDTQRQPVLMQQLLQQDYEIAAFSAVGFGSPAQIDRTVFAATDPAGRITTKNTPDMDSNEAATLAWQDWLVARENTEQPFFSFVYFDPGAAKDSGGAVSQSELERKYQSYLHGIASLDVEVAKILGSLDEAGLRDNTLLIVASDHGYEFDELGLGYIGHASNYGSYQLRSTLIMDWPGKAGRQYTHRSAHQDLPATLLQDLLACSNPADEYSSGTNLFNETDWKWIIAGSYNSHAIVAPDKIVVTNPGGLIELLGPDYRPDNSLQLDAATMQEAVIEMRRFYR